jgi:hypothetical protein
MNQVANKFQESSLSRLYRSFSPASRAVILFAIPFTMIDAIHYFTAGSALIFSFPLLFLTYLLCGMFAARIAIQDKPDVSNLPHIGRSAAFRLWLTSTVINTLLAMFFGVASLGLSLLSGVLYLCVFAPLHAVGSALVGWLGGWIYQQYFERVNGN